MRYYTRVKIVHVVGAQGGWGALGWGLSCWELLMAGIGARWFLRILPVQTIVCPSHGPDICCVHWCVCAGSLFPLRGCSSMAKEGIPFWQCWNIPFSLPGAVSCFPSCLWSHSQPSRVLFKLCRCWCCPCSVHSGCVPYPNLSLRFLEFAAEM